MNASLNPVWEEASEFTIEPDALKEKKIELVVLDKKGLFTRYKMYFHLNKVGYILAPASVRPFGPSLSTDIGRTELKILRLVL